MPALALLFVRDHGQRQGAAQWQLRALDGFRGGDHRRHAALHVSCAAPDQPAVPDQWRVGVGRPAVAGRDDVQVAIENEMRTRLGPWMRTITFGRPGVMSEHSTAQPLSAR